MNQFSQISEQQRMQIMRYLDDRRSKFMIRMICSGALALLLTVPALIDAATLFHTKILIFQPSFANRRTGLIAFLWFFLLIVFLVHFALGVQRYFGGHSPLAEMRSYRYTVRKIILSSKEEDKGVHPFVIHDVTGEQYTCPVYLDYKHAEKGEHLIGIVTDHGGHFALRAEQDAAEPDPRELPQF